jgi:hypothetical protein
MAPPTLTVLPTETLVCICTILYESHIPSLAAFSLGNKRCFAIAARFSSTPSRLTSVSLPSFPKMSMRAKITPAARNGSLPTRPAPRHCRPNGQSLGRHRLRWHEPNWEHTPDSESGEVVDRTWWRYRVKRPTWNFALPTTTDWEITRARLHRFQFGSAHGRGAIPIPTEHGASGLEGTSDMLPASMAYDTDHHWRPLADIISHLSGLVDVVFRCPSQFPPCLLKAIMLHANKGQIRLHLQIFKLRSAYDDSARY